MSFISLKVLAYEGVLTNTRSFIHVTIHLNIYF